MKFFSDRRGNVAMMFALMLIPMLIGAGIGLDLVRANQMRTKMAEASDAGLLAAARAKILNPALSDAEAKAIAGVILMQTAFSAVISMLKRSTSHMIRLRSPTRSTSKQRSKPLYWALLAGSGCRRMFCRRRESPHREISKSRWCSTIPIR